MDGFFLMPVNIKLYQCIKQVHAEPMTFGEFSVSIRKVRDMGQIDPTTPGYHVIYSRGAQDEYHSWSPKPAFEEGYIYLPANAKKPAGKLS
jgi:hypothetical protein